MNTFMKHIRKTHLPSVLFLVLCTGLTGCQLPKEFFPETAQYREEQERQKHPQPPTPELKPQKQPFKKVTQEERDRVERDELERKKCKDAFETLRAFS